MHFLSCFDQTKIASGFRKNHCLFGEYYMWKEIHSFCDSNSANTEIATSGQYGKKEMKMNKEL